jgi:DNA-binding MarR family transcriptional regulator
MTTPSRQDRLPDRVNQVVRFDRFYSRWLREGIKAARVTEVNGAELGIFEELHHGSCTPGWLQWRLGLDSGYLSRNLRRLEAEGLVSVSTSDDDRRSRLVSLTARGCLVARSLAEFQGDAVRQRLEELPLRQQRRLVRAMNAIVEIFERDALTNLLESGR